MNCLVTAGPTYEPLDEVRRLTNFSTGSLGAELSRVLVGRGHEVRLLIGEQAVYRGELRATELEWFTTTADLEMRLERLAGAGINAVFHAAAVSDYTVGRVTGRGAGGEEEPMTGRKFSSRAGRLLVELVPAPKLIARLREWYPAAYLVGWKYELDGDRAQAVSRGEQQVRENRIDLTVVNGSGYGEGFGLVRGPGDCWHAGSREALCGRLIEEMEKAGGKS